MSAAEWPPRIDLDYKADLLDGGTAPLVCGCCGVEEAHEQTAVDPLMYLWHGSPLSEIECDGCLELRHGWAQECTVTRWEDGQR